MFAYLEQILISLASHIPPAFFAPVASFIEEVIPPIPSPSIMIVTGSLALVQEYPFYSLFFLAFLGAIGKTFGAAVVYYVADKVEDLLSGKIAKFIGITHEQIESFGARLGKGSRDYFILIILRALPIMPSTLISVGGGLLKIRLKLFIISTFIGSMIRNFIYIYLGYAGTTVVSSFVKKTTSAESIIQIIAVIVIVLVVGFLYYKRRKMV
jgi:membrane protein DedA with SNARE-associated domain